MATAGVEAARANSALKRKIPRVENDTRDF
jgi:hypothetical protein